LADHESVPAGTFRRIDRLIRLIRTQRAERLAGSRLDEPGRARDPEHGDR